MNDHFHTLNWTIKLLNHNSKELEIDGETRSSFIHEYIHYVQFLISTFGRVVLIDYIRNIILAGLHKHYYPKEIPENFDQISLLEELQKAVPSDFTNSEAQQNLEKLYYEIKAMMDAKPDPIHDTSQKFIYKPLETQYQGKCSIDNFPHVVIKHGGRTYALALNDRLLFDNMARQIQKNYLFFTLNDTSSVDRLRNNMEEKPYICLWKLIDDLSHKRYDSRLWTIVISQFALMCGKPGDTFIRIYNCIRDNDFSDIDDVIKAIKRDDEIEKMYDNPPIQEIVNDLILKYGTAMLPHENNELKTFLKPIISACNSVAKEPKYFSNPCLNWNETIKWLKMLGCPPIVFKDGQVTSIYGVQLGGEWYEYLKLGTKLLLPKNLQS